MGHECRSPTAVGRREDEHWGGGRPLETWATALHATASSPGAAIDLRASSVDGMSESLHDIIGIRRNELHDRCNQGGSVDRDDPVDVLRRGARKVDALSLAERRSEVVLEFLLAREPVCRPPRRGARRRRTHCCQIRSRPYGGDVSGRVLHPRPPVRELRPLRRSGKPGMPGRDAPRRRVSVSTRRLRPVGTHRRPSDAGDLFSLRTAGRPHGARRSSKDGTTDGDGATVAEPSTAGVPFATVFGHLQYEVRQLQLRSACVPKVHRRRGLDPAA